MVFHFREVTVSGANEGVEGMSGMINAITDAMVTAGWSIVDDRRGQAGSSLLTTTHKIVLVNDGGESGTSPNIYFTMTSGTSATVNQITIGMQISGAYDVGSHDVPASGVRYPDSGLLSQMRTFIGDPDGYNHLWIAADKDQVTWVNNSTGNTNYHVVVGKVKAFLDEDSEPYGAVLYSSVNVNISNGATGIVGNPPEVIDVVSDGDFFTYSTLSTKNEPRAGLGNKEAIFTAVPILWSVDDAAPVRKGVIGFVKHLFTAANQSAGLPPFGRLVVSGTGQEFAVFGTTNTLVMRAN